METTLTTCKSCGNAFVGRYCNHCGEKVYTDHDRTMLHFVEEGIHFFTHFEGTFFTTIKYIFTRPGRLSADYCYGRRKTLFKPLSLFFLLVVIYLLFPVFDGLNMKLQYHLSGAYRTYAKTQVLHVLQQQQWTEAQLAEAFHKSSSKVSKFLLLVILPLTALFFWVFTFKKRRYFFDQMVFATEINCVYLIWGFLLLPLLLSLFEACFKWLAGHYLPVTDDAISLVMYGVLLLYVVLAARRFYELSLVKALLLAVLFYFVHNIIVQLVYKFLLFYIAIKLVH